MSVSSIWFCTSLYISTSFQTVRYHIWRYRSLSDTDLSRLVTVYILSNIISVTGSDEDEELREAAAEEKQTSPSIYINSR